MSKDSDRIEDLEEALREIVFILQRQPYHDSLDHDAAAIEIALDRLGLSTPPLPYWKHS